MRFFLRVFKAVNLANNFFRGHLFLLRESSRLNYGFF